MKSLLLAMKVALQSAEELIYVVDADIFITPHEDIIPNDATFPCIGLKDGDIEREESAHKVIDEILEVDVVAYQLLKAGEITLIGNGETHGLFDLISDIRSVLDYNELGLDNILRVYIPNELASDFMGAEDVVVQRKIVTYRYVKRVFLS